MKKFLTGLLLCPFLVFAQETERPRYSGGMLIFQPGIAFAVNPRTSIRSYSSGIGGVLRLYFGPVFTSGLFGGTQNLTYVTAGSENSNLSLGYGGAFAGLSLSRQRLRYTFSLGFGGGSFKNLHIESQIGETLTDAVFYQRGVMVISPMASLDYHLSKRLSATLQMNSVYVPRSENQTYTNLSLQLGLLFRR
jgi:hypothetical protein